MRARRLAEIAALAALALGAGCGGDSDEEPAAVPEAPDSIRLDSQLFRDGARLSTELTCDGEGVSPPLRWSDVPDRASELALIVADPDAPDGPFTHWVVYLIRPSETGFPQGGVPGDAVQGENSDGQEDYFPPCPPEGDPDHHYEFTLYASAGSLELADGATADDVLGALADSTLARGTLTGTYSR
jgi:Raf kinase inhibitor-like YbhB/YbcL family protein